MTPEEIRAALQTLRMRLSELQTELDRKDALLRAGRDVNGDGTFDEHDAAAVQSARARRDACQARLEALEEKLVLAEANAAAEAAIAGASAAASAISETPEQAQARRAEELQEQVEENRRLEQLSPDQLIGTPLIEGDADDLFDEDYMETVADHDPPYAGDESLKVLMRKIEQGVSGPDRAEVMEQLARIVGEPPSAAELDADYGRFLIVQRQQEANGGNKGQESTDLDETRHPDFMASRGQLMFGKVLGDAFDIHEVFASLLSPTGGLVGPGNDFLPVEGLVDGFHLAPDNPVGVHGTLHDAAGYLKTFHNDGPGYNYRDDPYEEMVTDAIALLPDDWESSVLPLTGQISGIYYWGSEIGGEYLDARYDEALTMLEDGLSEARDEAAEMIGDLLGRIEEKKQEASDAYDAVEAEVEDRIDQAGQDLRDLADTVEDEVRDAIDAMEAGAQEASDAFDAFADDMTKRADEAEEGLRDFAEAAEAEVLGALDAFNDAVDRAATSAVEAYEEVAEDDRSMTEIAQDKLNELADFIWS